MAESSGPHEVFLYDRSGARYGITEPRWRGDDGTPLSYSELSGIAPDEIDATIRTHWRYRRAFPPGLNNMVTLGEGCTPLVEKAWHGVPVLFKLEGCNPTGSFKDRGTSALISGLLSQGVRSLVEDSSGNAGASIGAYAAAAGISARIIVPDTTSTSKLVQMKAYGAEVVRVGKSRAETAAHALHEAETVFYASHNWHPLFIQGTKSIAYELWEDLGFRAPDHLVLVAGSGSLVLGCALGFGELLGHKQITKLPRLLVAQPANCSPLVRAFQAGADRVSPHQWRRSIAAGASVSQPVRDLEVLAAIRASGGAIVAVTEKEIRSATRELARMGIYVEPTSATAAAALEKFRAMGPFEQPGTTVIVLTGSGLKATDTIAEIL